MVDYKIDTMKETDWEQARSIYIEGVSTGDASFETEELWGSVHHQ